MPFSWEDLVSEKRWNSIDAVMQDLEIPSKIMTEPHLGWWFNQPAILREPELKFFEQADRRLPRTGTNSKRRQHRDKYLATLTFGLWANLFTKGYDTLFAEKLVYAFPCRPEEGFQRKTVLQPINKLHLLRNRIGHHQPIFDLPLEELYQMAFEVLGWLSKDLQNWVDDHQSVTELLNTRPKQDDPLVVVVPVTEGWKLVTSTKAYVCQPQRFFRTVSHIAFYVDGEIKPDVYPIERRVDNVPWTGDEIARLYRTNDSEDCRLAEVIKEYREHGFENPKYQVFLLDSQATDKHIQLDKALRNDKRGRGSAWVRRQRYVKLQDLQNAQHISDLDG